MEENNHIENAPGPQNTPGPKKPSNGMAIVGINLLALAFYTLAFKFIDGGIIPDAFLLVLHVIFCLGMAIGQKSWVWVLAGVLVLAIGFSTCVYLLPLNLK